MERKRILLELEGSLRPDVQPAGCTGTSRLHPQADLF
jgi:hypothetical protein